MASGRFFAGPTSAGLPSGMRSSVTGKRRPRESPRAPNHEASTAAARKVFGSGDARKATEMLGISAVGSRKGAGSRADRSPRLTVAEQFQLRIRLNQSRHACRAAIGARANARELKLQEYPLPAARVGMLMATS